MHVTSVTLQPEAVMPERPACCAQAGRSDRDCAETNGARADRPSPMIAVRRILLVVIFGWRFPSDVSIQYYD